MPQFLKALYGRVPCRPAFCYVTTDPEGDADGGGGEGDGDDAGDDDDEDLGPQGKKALSSTRKELRTLKKEAVSTARELEALRRNVSPEVLKAAQDAADEAQRKADAKDQELAQERTRLTTLHRTQIQQLNSRAEAAELKATQKTIEFLTKEQFYAVGGDESVDDDGISTFKAFMDLKGHKHLRIDKDERLYVVDAAGDELLDDKGNPVKVQVWITKQADASPVLARLFKPRKGEGSGTQSSTGVRGVRGPDLHSMSRGQLGQVAWPDR
jgi:hypothetical protein